MACIALLCTVTATVASWFGQAVEQAVKQAVEDAEQEEAAREAVAVGRAEHAEVVGELRRLQAAIDHLARR